MPYLVAADVSKMLASKILLPVASFNTKEPRRDESKPHGAHKTLGRQPGNWDFSDKASR
ncbi:MAG: hypothetical protein PHV74_12305 [Dehalococcoidia bacterium]|nr:hypothetical protein [Dehalococcoidia bacterium]